MELFTASAVLPVSAPPLADGAVAVEGGRIVAVGRRAELARTVPAGTTVHDLGEAVVLPGLVNAHAHVELSWLAADPPPRGDYMAWLCGLLERRETEDPRVAREAAADATRSMVARGTVAVGDVGNGTWVVPILARSRLDGLFFHEGYGLRPGEAAGDVTLGMRTDTVDGWAVLPTPHAPHTCSERVLRMLCRRPGPVSIHVAESREECQLLRDGSGPFRPLFERRGLWDAGRSAPAATPVELLDRLGLLGADTLAVHCVQLTEPDFATLARSGATVVTCPRSNTALGVGRAPVQRLLADGVPVALGTDSLASSPDLDLFAEMAALLDLHPSLSPSEALHMATLGGAAALGLDDLGSIAPGKRARLAVVPLEPGADPLEAVGANPAVVHSLEDAPRQAIRR